jgi:FkbM family methyltransferase
MEKIIYDIGMHAGRDTEFYLKKGFKVVAIEANPALVEKATIKFKEDISTGRLIIIDKAIAPAGVDTIEFYTNEKHDDWGTIIPDWNRGQDAGFKSITVQTVPLQTIIQTHGVPYYMKIDIEGADTLCLQSLTADERGAGIPEHRVAYS